MKILSFMALFSMTLFAQIMGPKIYFPSDTYDFGTIKQGEIVSHTFPIVNKGDDTLKIQSVLTSCGCTAAELKEKEIAPGQVVNLKIDFNSAGKIGQQIKYISIASNDKDNAQSRVILRGSVLEEKYAPAVAADTTPHITFTETEFDFGEVKEGQVVTHIFNFSNTGKSVLEIKSIQTSCGCTAVVIATKVLQPGEAGSLRVDFDSSGKHDKLSRTITITTNEVRDAIKTLNIFANVKKLDK